MPLVFLILVFTSTFIASIILTLCVYFLSLVIPDFPVFSPFLILVVFYIAAHLIFVFENVIHKNILAAKYQINISTERAEYKLNKKTNKYPFILHYALLLIALLIFLTTIFTAYGLGFVSVVDDIISKVYLTTFGIFFSYVLVLFIVNIIFMNRDFRYRLGKKSADYSFSLGVSFFLILAFVVLLKYLYDAFNIFLS